MRDWRQEGDVVIAHRGLPAAAFAGPELVGRNHYIVIAQIQCHLSGQHDSIAVGHDFLDYANFIAPKVIDDGTALPDPGGGGSDRNRCASQ